MKRCGECRLGLGVHHPEDPYCVHHVALDPDVYWTKREPERDYSGERGQ